MPLTEEQRYEAKLAALRAAIDEGDASGIAEGDVFARVREALGLSRPGAGDQVAR
jgi:antitoxin ParD1/3/4